MENAEKSRLALSRKCNYDPTVDMISIKKQIGDREREEKYLEVKYRVQWFNIFCEENGIQGVIDDADVCYIPETKTYKATASVFMDGALAGKSSAGVFADTPDRLNVAIQTAATFAKGRALANAGFGTANCSSAEEGASEQCDAGIVVKTNPMNPMEARIEPVPSRTAQTKPAAETGTEPQAEKPRRQEKPAESKSEKAENPMLTNQLKMPTYEDALRFVIPIGSFKGKTFSEALGERGGIAEFYASPQFTNTSHPMLKLSAQAIVNHAAQA